MCGWSSWAAASASIWNRRRSAVPEAIEPAEQVEGLVGRLGQVWVRAGVERRPPLGDGLVARFEPVDVRVGSDRVLVVVFAHDEVIACRSRSSLSILVSAGC